VLSQRKYIIGAFLIFAVLFIGFYLVQIFFLKRNAVSNVMRIDQYYAGQDTSIEYKKGKTLFQSQCASCHSIFRDIAGPALAGVEKRWPNKKELYEYIRNPQRVLAKTTNIYLKKLDEKYKITPPAFEITDREIDAILLYISSEQ
jgi:cytochrome c2